MPKEPKHFPFFVFGNKKDKEAERQIHNSSIKEWVKKNNNIPYQETSALDSVCIERAFEKIA